MLSLTRYLAAALISVALFSGAASAQSGYYYPRPSYNPPRYYPPVYNPNPGWPNGGYNPSGRYDPRDWWTTPPGNIRPQPVYPVYPIYPVRPVYPVYPVTPVVPFPIW